MSYFTEIYTYSNQVIQITLCFSFYFSHTYNTLIVPNSSLLVEWSQNQLQAKTKQAKFKSINFTSYIKAL